MEERPVEHGRPEFSELPLSVVIKIDQLADEFEAQWHSGLSPDVESYVQQIDAAGTQARAALESHLRQLSHELQLHAELQNVTPPVAAGTTSPTVASSGPPIPIPESGEPIAIGEYRLLEQLGSGGMGVVYQAWHATLDRLVAIKFPRLATALDPRAAGRFLREAKLVGRLRHPHIVQALDASESPYGPYLVTEYVEGETLEALVRRMGPLPFEMCMCYALQAAGALEYAHSQGIIHRDIKPSNMLLDKQGELRIVDFGLAKMHQGGLHNTNDSAGADHTDQGTFLGTVGYAAPEQLFAEEAVDQRADVYSLGCVIYFMLTGEPPHKGSLTDRLMSRQSNKGLSADFRADKVSPGFFEVWSRMTAEDPLRRYSWMSAVKSALESELNQWQEGHKSESRSHAVAMLSTAAILVLALVAWRFLSSHDHTSSAGIQRDPPPRAIVPFDAKQGQQHQQSWADYLDLPVRAENSIGMRLVLIPAGEFEMGPATAPDPPELTLDDWRYVEPDELVKQHLPQHRVILTSAYYFAETEVTFAEFRQFIEESGYVTAAEHSEGWGKEDRGWLRRAGYSWKNTGQWVSKDDHPVMNVNWNDATEFCRWLTEKDKLGTYRLPTEAEWEFACRAGTTTTYYFGDDSAEMDDHAWFKGNLDIAYHRVGRKKPNPFGLYDLYGNRQEWCQDVFAADFYGRSPLSDPICRTGGDERAMRGGAHTDLAAFCTSTRRWSQAQDNVGAAGIRVVCIPK